MKHLTALLALIATPAWADFPHSAGDFFVYARDYDHTSDTFTDAPEVGLAQGCFQITDVALERKQIEFVLISGTISPWWADGEVFKPGFENAWVPPIAFMENRPDALWTDLIVEMIQVVPDCPTLAS